MHSFADNSETQKNSATRIRNLTFEFACRFGCSTQKKTYGTKPNHQTWFRLQLHRNYNSVCSCWPSYVGIMRIFVPVSLVMVSDKAVFIPLVSGCSSIEADGAIVSRRIEEVAVTNRAEAWVLVWGKQNWTKKHPGCQRSTSKNSKISSLNAE